MRVDFMLLKFQSQDLVTAAYNSDWMNSSKEFKRSIIIFMEQTKKPMCVVGMKMFLLSLDTFITVNIWRLFFIVL